MLHPQTGESGEQVGAIRATVIGSGVVVEQLVAVDAEEHYMSVRLPCLCWVPLRVLHVSLQSLHFNFR